MRRVTHPARQRHGRLPADRPHLPALRVRIFSVSGVLRVQVLGGVTCEAKKTALIRHLSDVVYKQMLRDTRRAAGGSDPAIQSGRFDPNSRHFGQVTTRTRHHEARNNPAKAP
ncbi:hypothetical protein GCM10009557_35170 [Virgisporangium ochraceum]|uniref:Uncharacterized protein n=1 Tax=Virgisporangium ochraceum TaxID=65505 RepID=A0A8J4A937_9ACTN|nr:hypothetical protein Voc01_101630 [Virgisporangium ochraceum]